PTQTVGSALMEITGACMTLINLVLVPTQPIASVAVTVYIVGRSNETDITLPVEPLLQLYVAGVPLAVNEIAEPTQACAGPKIDTTGTPTIPIVVLKGAFVNDPLYVIMYEPAF